MASGLRPFFQYESNSSTQVILVCMEMQLNQSRVNASFSIICTNVCIHTILACDFPLAAVATRITAERSVEQLEILHETFIFNALHSAYAFLF